jgi:kynureninase
MYENTLPFAKDLDKKDPLSHLRDRFHIPKVNGKDSIYLCGNSLGLQPKTVKQYINQELEDWAELGVEGHLKARNPWYSYHEKFASSLARLVGGQTSEVVAMNGLTVNLHLMLISFYQPKGKRHKILCEKKAFPSDQYAFESQVRFHGYDPDDAIIEVSSNDDSPVIKTEQFLEQIEKYKDDLALVVIGGVNYYTGQLFDLKKIAEKAHEVGVLVGYDLAHAVGNVELKLHDWGVDFGVWCSYKYLNSGAGGIAGAFVHERHLSSKDIPRLAGWWGHDKDSRFLMEPGFNPIPSAEGWQLSNAPVFSMVPHLASLELFEEVGMEALCKKRDMLTGYLEFLIQQVNQSLKIITPNEKNERGCQLSILTGNNGKLIHDHLTKEGVISDWRNPNVIRVAPVPMYNTFEDVYRFAQMLNVI